jgi:predicted nucleic acid-binding protein
MDAPCVVVPAPGPGHWDILAGLLLASQARGPLVSDAHLAALTLEHGGVLATTDRDFSRFEGLRVIDPLRTS